MKKIFTLIGMALVAMSVNAQTETWDTSKLTWADEEVNGKTVPVLQDAVVSINNGASFVIPAEANVFPEGTYPDNISVVTDWLDSQPNASEYAIELTEYTFTVNTGNITLKAVSTPNSDAAKNEGWQLSTQENEGLTTDDCFFKISNYVKPKNGDPSIGYYNFYDKNGDGENVSRVANIQWTPGCGKLPQKGCYYEISTMQAGTLLMAVSMAKNLSDRPLYIIDESTEAEGYTVLAPSEILVEGFLQNNGWDGWHEKVWHQFTVGEDYKLYEDGDLAPNSRTFYGYVTFNVEAGKSYIIMNPNNQMGLYGYYFAASGTDGIANVAANESNIAAPVYNLAGQKVDNGFKGLLIKNGKKFINK